MQTITYKELDRSQQRQAITAYHQRAFDRVYQIDDTGTAFVFDLDSAGVTRRVRIGQDPDAYDEEEQ